MKAYETTYGRLISGRVLGELREDLERGVDWQRAINDNLRPSIPAHPDDMDEAMEVLRHVEEAIDAAMDWCPEGEEE